MAERSTERVRVPGRSAEELLPLLRQHHPTWSEENLRKLAEAEARVERNAERDLNDVR